ncbi:MAG: 50S ribosomal protein L4 [Phycisphaeraceae bacterium]|nr:50S ribosomal protein L4 [Phycisphaerales bacterium]MCB9860275.1 50S ribosomal protein L4 [Phycisphaeraceae bacterium]
MEVTVYNMDGTSVGTMTVDEAALGGEVNPALIKQAYVHYHANLRQGSSRTKTRSEVAGSTKKMGRQKGSGGARHGTKRAPIFRGGGHTFAKKRTREDYHLAMPKKMKRKANRNALLAKLIDNEVKVVDSLAMNEPKTSLFRNFLKQVGVDRTVLVALRGGSDEDANAKLSARNIDDVTICRADQLNCFQMLNCRYMVIEKSQLEAWLSGPSSQTGKEAKINPMGRANGGND